MAKETKQKKKNSKKTVVLNILLIVCLGVFLFCAYNIGMTFWKYKEAQDEYKDLSDIAYIVRPTEKNSDVSFSKPTGETLPGNEEDIPYEYVCPIDFPMLKEMNQEIVAWISIPGTDIEYPLVQGKDNDKYLTQTAKGTWNSSGAIFVDYRNALDFSDVNTLIYGHNMNDGSMFSGLLEYKDRDFFDQYPSFFIYFPEAEYRFDIVAAHLTPDGSYIYNMNFPDENEISRFIASIAGNSFSGTDIELTVEDHFVVLSTCDYTYENARFVVVGKLVPLAEE